MHFIAACAIFKMILGRYLQIEPKQVQFYYGPTANPISQRDLVMAIFGVTGPIRTSLPFMRLHAVAKLVLM
jgi:hypothetical protein